LFAIGAMVNKAFFDESTEQSRVKAAIVNEYFWAWAKVILSVMQKQGDMGPIAYIDLFAGPGRYRDGTASTPLLILQKAMADPELRKRLVTLFNDVESEHVSALKKEIAKLPGVESLKFQPQVEGEEVGTEIVKKFEQRNPVPTLLFVDPWGYKGLSLALINSVLKNWGCDCIFFFNYNRINPGLGNEAVKARMDVLFGMERARQLRERLAGLPSSEREPAIIEALCEAVSELGAKYVLPFCFKDDRGARTSHHLVFATKNPVGYGIMKDIMAKHSSEQHQGVASFGYCPASTIHPMLFELNRPLDDLEEMLLQDFAGQTLTTKQIYERHNVGRPYTMKNYRAILLKMEESGLFKAEPPAEKRRKSTFAETVRVTFPKETIHLGSI
jgi:three-Cys-motif partner protein